MKRRNTVVAAIVLVITLPAVFALASAVRFHVHNHNNGSLISAGVAREYLLHVPRSYDRARPAPLVISMHGAGGWPALQRNMSRWNRLADREGFLVVYPAGLARGGPRVWRAERDARFIAELIGELRADYNIDRQRIYANGLSNGAGMSFVLSCALSDRIAAVGMVAAAHTVPWRWCTDRRAVPMIAFHGTADPVTPYNGGRTWISTRAFPAIPTWVARWAQRNQCRREPRESAIAADVTRRDYADCAHGAAVVLYTLHGAGHTWPGGDPLPEWFMGRTSRTVDATSEMWAFFRAHRLRGPAPD